ncbi:pilus assembly protein CpaE [Salinibacterium sp. G-O1]|uniref:pilus assembly protein CpaE n=1 Tax=Salinibacterium sp. G-O1 TaxID=3046208 RepID=UPI0024BAAD29|nr:pilus assembly protein CpaE [Salinibacterium sp. G-O1]MDJ0335972.1 pilus assembly protein CpaE [Salinibacterium sp. G-O1]
MISTSLARALRDSGLTWRPSAGDAFRIDRVEADDEVYILSDMTVEAHDYGTGVILGFNGTTEWALDSVALEDALWMPHEHQLRQFLAGTFRSLTATAGPVVEIEIEGKTHSFGSDDAANAYARAALYLLDSLAVQGP